MFSKLDENTRIELIQTGQKPNKKRRPAIVPLNKERVLFFVESQVN